MMSDSEVDETPPPPSLAATRSRREKSDKHGRFAALQKFKVRLAHCAITVAVAFRLFTFKIKVLNIRDDKGPEITSANLSSVDRNRFQGSGSRDFMTEYFKTSQLNKVFKKNQKCNRFVSRPPREKGLKHFFGSK